jgi:hypothetical protein
LLKTKRAVLPPKIYGHHQGIGAKPDDPYFRRSNFSTASQAAISFSNESSWGLRRGLLINLLFIEPTDFLDLRFICHLLYSRIRYFCYFVNTEKSLVLEALLGRQLKTSE